MPPDSVPYRSLYSYPWDVVEMAPSRLGEIVSAQGLNAVTLAISYHAGKFLRPEAKSAGSIFRRMVLFISIRTLHVTEKSNHFRIRKRNCEKSLSIYQTRVACR